MKCRLFLLAALPLGLLLPAASLLAQGERGAITGLVTDPSGAAITHVEVVARETQTGVESKAETTASGLYRMPYLPPGTYRVMASAAGFKSAVIDRVEVSVAAVVTANLKLEVGDVSQSVTVSAEATLLQSSSSE